MDDRGKAISLTREGYRATMGPVREARHGVLSTPLLAAGAAVMVGLASLAVAAGDPQRGRVVYEKNCQGCHGKAGAGVGGATPNLADAGRMAQQSDQDLFDVVTHGRPGTGMPAWGSILNEQDRWSVVSYLRTLAKK